MIATVDKNGKITGKKTGQTAITVTLVSGKSEKITVKIQKVAVKTKMISGLDKKISLEKGSNTAVYNITVK